MNEAIRSECLGEVDQYFIDDSRTLRRDVTIFSGDGLGGHEVAGVCQDLCDARPRVRHVEEEYVHLHPVRAHMPALRHHPGLDTLVPGVDQDHVLIGLFGSVVALAIRVHLVHVRDGKIPSACDVLPLGVEYEEASAGEFAENVWLEAYAPVLEEPLPLRLKSDALEGIVTCRHAFDRCSHEVLEDAFHGKE